MRKMKIQTPTQNPFEGSIGANGRWSPVISTQMPEKYVQEKDEASESAWDDQDVDMVNHNASSRRGGLMISNKDDATNPKVTNI